MWSRDELESFPYAYERSKEKLGNRWLASTLTDLASNTRSLFFAETPQAGPAALAT
jgi:hypothetical protein